MENIQIEHKLSEVIVPLQMLRGFAACLVVSEHFLDRLGRRGALPNGLPPWAHELGNVGVTAFFVMSGFIMVYTTIGEFGAPRAGKRFIARRLERIVPLYWLTSLGMMVFSPLTTAYSTNSSYIAPTWQMVFFSALFVPHISRNYIAQPIYTLGWTLEYEMFFYLIFAITLIFQRRLGLIVTMGVFTTLVGIGTMLASPPPILGKIVAIYYFTRPIMMYFVAGMLIAWLRVVHGTIRVNIPGWTIGATAVLVLSAAIRWGIGTPGLEPALVVFSVALPTLLNASGTQPATVTSMSMLFGNISYSIYLTHSFLLGALALVAARFVGHGLPVLLAFVVAACLCCAAAAWPVWRFVERPMTRAFHQPQRAR